MKEAIRKVLIVSLLFVALITEVRIEQALANAPAEVATPAISFEEFITPIEVVDAIEPIETIDIILTRYYPGEGGSDTCTSTLCTSRFQINEKGWYTYEGKIVIGAATKACLAYCKYREEYGPFPSDYRIYDFYDEIQFVLEGTTYVGIVLDSCGACMYHINGEKFQRYDIFTVSGNESSSLLEKSNVGKVQAKLIVNSLDD